MEELGAAPYRKELDMQENYDVLIVTTAKDYLRLQCNYPRLIQNMPGRRLIFVGNEEVGQLVAESGLGERAGFLPEDAVIPFADVHSVMRRALGREDVPRGVTGWYYQQFLKMQYAARCQDEYYLMWDGDTVPCKPFSMFSQESGLPYLDLKHEYHEEYFRTLEKLLPGMHKCIQQSFISEHMLINREIMRSLIRDIEANGQIPGTLFYEKIIHAIEPERLVSNSFSEFETYGTYVAFRRPTAYKLRSWNSFRYAGEFLDPYRIDDEDYEWLGRSFDALSFEKGHTVRPDHQNLFDNKEYQSKLSARQMLEIAQEEFKDSYMEVWEN